MRLIDADFTIYAAEGEFSEEDASKVRWLISHIPTIDAEPVRHGQWATDKEDIEWGNSLKRKHCTNCGERPHFDKEKREFVLTKYCPHCGAKMDLEV